VSQERVSFEKDFPRFVVVHWNRPVECLATIRASMAQIPNLHILVLDNNSSFANYETICQQLDPSVEVLRFQENKGWGPALNVALRKWLNEETSRYCFISAHDAELAADCLTRLEAAMEADPKLGIACPQYPDCSVPHLSALHGVSYKFVNPPILWRNFPSCESPARQLGKLAPPLPEHVESIDVPHGTFMIVRRECLAQIGLFDERYFAYGDEQELGARARRHGWKVGLVWGAMVANPQTSAPNPAYLLTRNSLLLVHDYFGKWAALLRALVILVNTVRLMIFPQQKNIAFSARAQWRGFLNYLAGRYGPPPSR
jgi:N-acetylglucosaminyl-diphospho-decaprenol L-rhamnosyltransferase